MKRQWKLWAGLIISVVALVLALRGIDLRLAWTYLLQADPLYLLLAIAALLVYLGARSVRWRLLLGRSVTLSRCFWATNAGYLVSNILPFRLGDVARAAVIGRGSATATTAALMTVIVERVLDMVMVVGLLAATLPFVAEAGWVQEAGWVAGLVALAVLGVLFLLAWQPNWVRRAAQWTIARIPRLDSGRGRRVWDSLLNGLAALRSAREVALLLGWSLAAWLLSAAYYWAILCAFLDRSSAVQAGFLTGVIGLGMAIPAAPASFGVYQAVARYALELPFGLSSVEAVAIAFTAHAISYVSMSLLGLAALAQLGLSWGRLRSEMAAVEQRVRPGEGAAH